MFISQLQSIFFKKTLDIEQSSYTYKYWSSLLHLHSHKRSSKQNILRRKLISSKKGYSGKNKLHNKRISRKDRKLLLSKTEEIILTIKMSQLQNLNPVSQEKNAYCSIRITWRRTQHARSYLIRNLPLFTANTRIRDFFKLTYNTIRPLMRFTADSISVILLGCNLRCDVKSLVLVTQVLSLV